MTRSGLSQQCCTGRRVCGPDLYVTCGGGGELRVQSRRSLQPSSASWVARICSAQCSLCLGLSGHVRCRADTGVVGVIHESRRPAGGLVSLSGSPFALFFSAPLPCASVGSLRSHRIRDHGRPVSYLLASRSLIRSQFRVQTINGYWSIDVRVGLSLLARTDPGRRRVLPRPSPRPFPRCLGAEVPL
jgi:hypothetical protein